MPVNRKVSPGSPPNLRSLDARRRLPSRKEYYWLKLDIGIYLGYRSSNHTWHARIRRGSQTYKRRLGQADTYLGADGETVLSYRDAVKKALELADSDELTPRTKLTYRVRDAYADYKRYLRAHTKAWKKTEHLVETRILPQLGNVPCEAMTKKRVDTWMEAIAESKPWARSKAIREPETGKIIRERKHRPPTGDPDEDRRRRQASANRLLRVLKAMLRHAWRNGDVASLDWSKARPFDGADVPVIRFLTEGECRRLLEHLDEDFRPLALATLLTAARYGELRHTKVRDYDALGGCLTVRKPKRQGTGSRVVELSDEARSLFGELTEGRPGDEWIFRRADGGPWGENAQNRRVRNASAAAGIDPPATMTILRHSVATHYLRAGQPLKLISEMMGHSNIGITAKHYAHLERSDYQERISRHGMKLIPGKVEAIKR